MALNKAKKAAKAVYYGTQDFSKAAYALEREAERLAGKSGSRNADVSEQAKIYNRLKKERGLSWKKSVKNRYNSM